MVRMHIVEHILCITQYIQPHMNLTVRPSVLVPPRIRRRLNDEQVNLLQIPDNTIQVALSRDTGARTEE